MENHHLLKASHAILINCLPSEPETTPFKVVESERLKLPMLLNDLGPRSADAQVLHSEVWCRRSRRPRVFKMSIVGHCKACLDCTLRNTQGVVLSETILD